MGSSSKKKLCGKKLFFYLLWFWTMLLIPFFSAKFYLELTHTLENNRHWKSSKMSLSKAVSGAVAFYITPTALFQNRLSLDKWLGYQEIFYQKAIDPKQIDFDFTLASGSYFSFLFQTNPQQLSGIRFSRNPSYPSGYFNATPEGKFLKKENLNLENLKEENHLQVLFAKNELSFYLNGKQIDSIREKTDSPFLIGFRGGAFPTSVAHIKILLKNGSGRILENFENRRGMTKPFLILLSALCFINFCLYLLKRWLKISKEKLFYFAFNFYFSTLITVLFLFTAQTTFLGENYYFSRIYFKTIAFLYDYKTSIETKTEVMNRLRKEYPLGKPTDFYRVLFVGSSQTWGAGSLHPEDPFVKKLEDRFNHESNGNISYEFINSGISGERVARLLKPYSEEWIRWNPKIVLINLSNNDTDTEKFAEYLPKFVQLNELKKIKTILILEANSIEQTRDFLATNHQTMKKVAAEYHLPVIDLHQCLLEKYDSGFLWWDFVHPTSYGHALAADCIYPTLHDVIEKEQQKK